MKKTHAPPDPVVQHVNTKGSLRTLVRNLRLDDENDAKPPSRRQLTVFGAYLLAFVPSSESSPAERYTQTQAKAQTGETAIKRLEQFVESGWCERDDRGYRRTPLGDQILAGGVTAQ